MACGFSLFLQINLSVPVIILFVSVPDLPHDSARITDCHDIRRDVFCDDTSCTDHGIVPDRHSRHNDHTRAEPDISSNMNRQIILVRLLAQFRQDRMSRRSDRHIRADHRTVSYIDIRVIYQCQIKVRVHLSAEMRMMPGPVGVERRLYVAVLADLCNIFFSSS